MDAKDEHPHCFGVLDNVFPKGCNDLRSSPESCFVCYCKTECLQTALSGADGLEVQAESVDRAYSAGVIGFWERWSRKKTLTGCGGFGSIKMTREPVGRKYKLFGGLALIILIGLALYVYRDPIWQKVQAYYTLFSDREQVKAFISSFGRWAPFIFMVIQILQVIFAPIPGEATGFIGGYLFGAFQGFVFSSAALTIGSWLNFSIGRFLGRRYVRKIVPASLLDRFNYLLKRQGIIVIFLLFVFPGFPKDYLCLFLGLSTLPLKVFILICAIGRMPGTLMLSLQGAFLFEQKIGLLGLILIVCLVAIFFTYRHREGLYLWIEKFSQNQD